MFYFYLKVVENYFYFIIYMQSTMQLKFWLLGLICLASKQIILTYLINFTHYLH